LPITEEDWSLISEAFKELYATARADFIQRQQDIANETTDLGMSQEELVEIYESMLRENSGQ